MKALAILSLLIATSIGYAQSPWVKKKGEIYSQISFSTISNYDKLIVPNAPNKEKNTERKITDNTLQLYGEIGLANKLSLIVNVPLKIIKSGDLTSPSMTPQSTSDSKVALGNIEIGIKRVFYQKKMDYFWSIIHRNKYRYLLQGFWFKNRIRYLDVYSVIFNRKRL